MKVLLVLPPLMQVNSPFPSTGYLAGYLASKGYQVAQRDLGVELFNALFSSQGLTRLRKHFKQTESEALGFFLEAYDSYSSTVDSVISFLQGRDPSLALRISSRNYLPEGPRFIPIDQHPELLESYGAMGLQDRAKYIASLYLDDISDAIRDGIDSDFGFSRYAESLASSQVSFEPLLGKLKSKASVIDELMLEIVEGYCKDLKPDVVGFSVPFPGNLYAALKSAAHLKSRHPSIKVVMGGGFVNTELRSLSDPRFFDYVDYLSFDDGERPLECLLEFLGNQRPKSKLFRTWYREGNKIIKVSDPSEKDVLFKSIQPPSFQGLPLDKYVSMVELPNPMHRMWSDFRWNKMILAHGCYWKRCSFCDVTLDYIGRYEPTSVETIIKNIEAVIAQTGNTGFHFVDEAAPPAILKQLSKLIIERGLKITWWGNLRFDKQFTPEVASLMAEAGCVAVTGGLEVASPRVLELINKGTNVEQVAKVTRAFKGAGIYVHAYLMYGFPTQTAQETVDSLEVVRQLFKEGCLDSGFWHRFLATAHSPVGTNPEKYGIELVPIPTPKHGVFARYDLPFRDSTNVDHEALGVGLRAALYNYMHGVGTDKDVTVWFKARVPKPKIPKTLIRRALQS